MCFFLNDCSVHHGQTFIFPWQDTWWGNSKKRWRKKITFPKCLLCVHILRMISCVCWTQWEDRFYMRRAIGLSDGGRYIAKLSLSFNVSPGERFPDQIETYIWVTDWTRTRIAWKRKQEIYHVILQIFGFETQGRRHHKSNTGVSVAPRKGIMSSKNF